MEKRKIPDGPVSLSWITQCERKERFHFTERETEAREMKQPLPAPLAAKQQLTGRPGVRIQHPLHHANDSSSKDQMQVTVERVLG